MSCINEMYEERGGGKEADFCQRRRPCARFSDEAVFRFLFADFRSEQELIMWGLLHINASLYIKHYCTALYCKSDTRINIQQND